MIPPRLQKELEDLASDYAVEIFEEPDFVCVVISGFPTSARYSHGTTTVLIRVPRAYPDAGMDMFWTDPGLTLVGGAIPRNAEPMEHYCGRQWRRFSWHHNGWNPVLNNFETYLEFVRRRFRDD